MSAILIAGGCEFVKEQNGLQSVEIGSVDVRDGGAHFSSRSIGPMTVARRSAALAATAAGDVIVVGGCSAPGVHESSAELFINNTNLWKPSSIMLQHGRSCCAQWSPNHDRLVLFGGYDGVDCLRSVEMIDIEQGNVESLKNLPCSLKNAASIPMNEDRTVLVGGWDGQRTLRTMFEFSLNDQTCSMLALLPFPVESHAIARNDHFAFVVGGYDGFSVIDSIVLVDLHNFESQVLSVRLAVARENHVCQIVQDKYLVVIGGWDGFRSLDCVEVFETVPSPPFLIASSTKGNLTCARNRPTSCLLPL
uniref:Uncharacterized protein n=1 Tax=Plectus sambesii TaxID=2011161 RepID=A0A914W767_9BILA